VLDKDGRESRLPYDELVIGTGATPVRLPIGGLDTLGPDHGVFLLHTMDDTFELTEFIDAHRPTAALIVGAGYLGLEMAEALTARGLQVTQVEMLPEVLPTVDPPLGRLVRHRLTEAAVEVLTETAVHRIDRHGTHLRVRGGHGLDRTVDLVLVVAGVQPDTTLAAAAGARLGPRGAVDVDRRMHTGIRTCGPLETVSSLITGCSAPPTCRSARQRTNRAASQERTQSAATEHSPASLAPRSSCKPAASSSGMLLCARVRQSRTSPETRYGMPQIEKWGYSSATMTLTSAAGSSSRARSAAEMPASLPPTATTCTRFGYACGVAPSSPSRCRPPDLRVCMIIPFPSKLSSPLWVYGA
jgi:hypothetical protein